MRSRLDIDRLGVIMSPAPGLEREAQGILNPAAARSPAGELLLFPRMVAPGNYSRIGIARVVFDRSGEPVAAERLGVALEPTEEYERGLDWAGCEDPRVSFVEPLGLYLMTYTALTLSGPRVAVAESRDLTTWRKRGLVRFDGSMGDLLDAVDNKDACFFPGTVPGPDGAQSFALLHRPLFPGTRPEETALAHPERRVDRRRESIWLSYVPENKWQPDGPLSPFSGHHLLASPVARWERLKVGAGTPPVLTNLGWLLFYHGVGTDGPHTTERRLRYAAGFMMLDTIDPRIVRFRSQHPVLSPLTQAETSGVTADVVFPTGIDQRRDIGRGGRFDVYYGMADDRIGVGRFDLPSHLPASSPAHHPNSSG